MAEAKKALRQFGSDWAAVANFVKTKTNAQCKNFYFNYKKKLRLDELLEEHRKEKVRENTDEKWKSGKIYQNRRHGRKSSVTFHISSIKTEKFCDC